MPWSNIPLWFVSAERIMCVVHKVLDMHITLSKFFIGYSLAQCHENWKRSYLIVSIKKIYGHILIIKKKGGSLELDQWQNLYTVDESWDDSGC